MSISEQLDHKRLQAVYLCKLLETVNEEIAELEQSDPYAELKAAHAAGKRIAVKGMRSYIFVHRPVWDAPIEHYKIVEDDETYYCQPHSPFGVLKTTFTKCALTGKVTAEVVE